MSTPFDRAAITEVVVLARELSTAEKNVLESAFPHAQVRLANTAEIGMNPTALFEAITYPKLVVVAPKYQGLIAVFLRNRLPFGFVENLGFDRFAVNRAEDGVVTRVFPEVDA